MSAASNSEAFSQRLRQRIARASSVVPIAEQMQFCLLSCDCEEIVMTCETLPWMRNVSGTLHGGLSAAILDQAMSFVAHSLKPGEGTAPAVQLSVNYHRPLQPGESVLVKVRVVSITRSLMHLTAEAFQASNQEKICLSGSGMYFFKPKL